VSFYNFWQADARINLQQNNNRVVHLSQWVFLYHCFFYDATYVNLLINIVMQDLKVLNISNRIKHYHYHHELSVSWLLFDHISLRFHGQTPQQKHLVLLDQDFRHATDTQLTNVKALKVMSCTTTLNKLPNELCNSQTLNYTQIHMPSGKSPHTEMHLKPQITTIKTITRSQLVATLEVSCKS